MTNSSPQKTYQRVLNSSTSDKFASLKHNKTPLPDIRSKDQHVPTTEEVICHLKMLKAFQLLKIKTVGNPGDIDDDGNFINFTDRQVKFWQAYLSNATRRFIIYMSALKYKFKSRYPFVDENQQLSIYRNDPNAVVISDFINGVLPPLDVLMIWHSFTLNPKAFYDNGVRNNFLEFTLCPFPLYQIAVLIDECTFVYQPPSSMVKEFHDFTRSFGVPLEYDYSFDLKMNLCITCPICKNVLIQRCSLTNSHNEGFADPGFSSVSNGKCTCTQYGSGVNHDDLRMRQIHADLVNHPAGTGTCLPFVTRIQSKLLNMNPTSSLDEFMKNSSGFLTNYLIHSSSWKSFIINVSEPLKKSSNPESLKILKLYEQTNLLHLTIPPTNRGCVEISEDLVAMTVRQERFIMKMNSFDLLNSKLLEQTISESIPRYLKFFKLMSENYMTSMLVPTLDIDLIWHTHQLSPIYYIQYSRSVTPSRFVIGHDDKVDEETLSSSFQHTGLLYYQRFGEHYYYCPCSFCNESPQNSRPIVKSLFENNRINKNEISKYLNTSTSSLLKVSNTDTNTNASHISAHNAVRKISKKKKMNYKTVRQRFPWNNWSAESRALDKCGSFFVLQPIGEDSTTTGEYPSDSRSPSVGSSSTLIVNSFSSSGSSKSNSSTSLHSANRKNSSNSIHTLSSLASSTADDNNLFETFYFENECFNG